MSCGSHFHCRTVLILHCHVALNTATLISICRVALISIQRSGYSHFHLSCRSHFHTAVGLLSFLFVMSLSFPLNVWLSLSLSRVAGRIPRAVHGRDVGHLSPRST